MIRAYNASSVGFGIMNLTDNTGCCVRVVVSNSIDYLMLKTRDLDRPEQVKNLLHNKTYRDVTYSMNGPMASKFTVKNIHCLQVS